MLGWDRWRKLLAEGAGGSFPRDEFESWVDAYEEHINALEAELSKHQESEFHPDWSLLEASRDSLLEHMGLLKKSEAQVAALIESGHKHLSCIGELERDLSRTMAALDQMEGNFNGMLTQRNKLADALDEQGIDSSDILADDDRQ